MCGGAGLKLPPFCWMLSNRIPEDRELCFDFMVGDCFCRQTSTSVTQNILHHRSIVDVVNTRGLIYLDRNQKGLITTIFKKQRC